MTDPNERTPYEIIGVSPYADDPTIAAAFRARMAEVHPDRASDEADRERRTAAAATVSAAYRVLRDPAARADLDLELRAANSFGWRIGRLKAAIGRRRVPRVPRPSFTRPEIRMPTMRMPEVELPFDAADVGARSSSMARTMLSFATETRLGQWLILLLCWAIPAIVDAVSGRGLPSQIMLIVLGAVALLIGRRGAPSPAHDAAALLLPLADRLGRAFIRTGARVAVGASVGAVRAARESKAWRDQMAEQVRREMAEAERRERGDRPRVRSERDGRYLPRDDREPRLGRREDPEARGGRREEYDERDLRFSRRDPRPERRDDRDGGERLSRRR